MPLVKGGISPSGIIDLAKMDKANPDSHKPPPPPANGVFLGFSVIQRCCVRSVREATLASFDSRYDPDLQFGFNCWMQSNHNVVESKLL